MRFATVATGAVNGYLAVRLAEAGADVACLARGAHLEAIRQKGLVLHAAGGIRSARPRIATDDPQEVGEVEAVLFAVKGQDLDAAAELCRPLIGSQTVVIPFLNGVEASGRLSAILGDGPVLEGTCGIAAFIASPGVVEYSSGFAWFRFAERDGTRSERAERVAAAMRAAEIDAEVPADVRLALWRKFMMLAPLSGITAAARCTAGDVASRPELTELARAAVGEVARLARAQGVKVTEAHEAETAAQFAGLPAMMRASMAKDLEAGRPLEVDWLSGAVARLSEEAGLEAPVHRTLHALLVPSRNGR